MWATLQNVLGTIMIPFWFLVALSLQEIGLLVAFALKQQWVDVLYWTGVQVVNVALIWRAYEQR